MKQQLLDWATDPGLSQTDFNVRETKLLHEIKLEKTAFRDEIVKSDIVDCFFVRAEKKIYIIEQGAKKGIYLNSTNYPSTKHSYFLKYRT